MRLSGKAYLNLLILLLFGFAEVPAWAQSCQSVFLSSSLEGVSSLRRTQLKQQAVALAGSSLKIATAEIGAGQFASDGLAQVVFGEQASMLRTTLSHSVSSYARQASDRRYGPIVTDSRNPNPYVSAERLQRQLEVEYQTLAPSRGQRRMVIANTAATARGNGLSWVGVRIETPRGPQDIRVQIRLKSARVSQQKEDLGLASLVIANSSLYSSPQHVSQFIRNRLEGSVFEITAIQVSRAGEPLYLEGQAVLPPVPTARSREVLSRQEATPPSLHDLILDINQTSKSRGSVIEIGTRLGIGVEMTALPQAAVYESMMVFSKTDLRILPDRHNRSEGLSASELRSLSEINFRSQQVPNDLRRFSLAVMASKESPADAQVSLLIETNPGTGQYRDFFIEIKDFQASPMRTKEEIIRFLHDALFRETQAALIPLLKVG